MKYWAKSRIRRLRTPRFCRSWVADSAYLAEALEDRYAPAADFVPPLSMPYQLNDGTGRDIMVAGQLPAKTGEVVQIALLDTPPVRNETHAGETRRHDDSFATPEEGLGTANQTPEMLAPLSARVVDPGNPVWWTGPDGQPNPTRAPNDFVFYRNVANQLGGEADPYTSNFGEPSVGTLGRVVFETGNTYASVSGDYGSHFKHIDPNQFGTIGGAGVCCDQRLTTDPDTDQFFWYMQYDKTGTTTTDYNGFKLARATGATALANGGTLSNWTTWTYTPSNFGYGASNYWFDYPHVRVSENFLYLTTDVRTVSPDAWHAELVVRISLGELASGTITPIAWSRLQTHATPWNSLALVGNAGTTMYSTSVLSNTSVVVTRQPETETTLYTSTVTGLNTSLGGSFVGPQPNGNNWAGAASRTMQTAWVTGSQLGMMWNSAQDTANSRPYPFVRFLLLDVSTYAVLNQYDLWSNTGSYLWPTASVNARGHVAGTIFYGTTTVYPSPVAYISDDISVAPPFVTYFATVGSGAGASRWGHYLDSQPHDVYTNTWVATGFVKTSTTGTGGGDQANVQPYYYWFGRERDAPSILGSTTDHGDTLLNGLVTGLTTGSTLTFTNPIWNGDYGTRDRDVYRFNASAGQKIYVDTYQPSLGDAFDNYVRLFDSSGIQLKADDDSGSGLYGRLAYTFQSTGTYYVGVSNIGNTVYDVTNPGSGSDGSVGDFTIALTLSSAVTVSSLSTIASPRNTAVSSIDVTFSGAIDSTSIGFGDFKLFRDGGANLITSGSGVTVTFVSGNTYRVNGLAGLTATAGSYEFQALGGQVSDTQGAAVYGSATRLWTMDLTGPSVTAITNIASLTNIAVLTMDFTFSEAINFSTLSISDLSLTRNGGSNLLTAGNPISLVSGNTYRVAGLGSLTSTSGVYEFRVNTAAVADALGNFGSTSATESWTADFVAPFLTAISSISPNPRGVAVSSIDFTFSEAINATTLTTADLLLTRNGNPVTLTGIASLSLVSGNTWRASSLGTLTATEGSYQFTVNGSGVADLAGNAATNSVNVSWIMDVTGPAILSIPPVTPNPRNTTLNSLQVTFDAPINLATFTAADLLLERNAVAVTLNGNEVVVLIGGSTYEIQGLVEETAADGNYALTVSALAVQDAAGNAGSNSMTATWVMDATAPAIVGVHFDGSTWSAAFRAAAGNAAFGYPAQVGAAQLTTMPWSTINRVHIAFSEDVAIDAADLAIRGIYQAGYAIAGFNYDSTNKVASFTLAGNIDTDRLILDLDGDDPTAVADALGNRLAGTWNESSGNFPTAGVAGVDFEFRFLVGVGDADRNGLARNGDLNVVRSNLFVDAGSGGYNFFADIDGNGLVRNADLNVTRNHLFVDPPAGPGPTRPNVRGRALERRDALPRFAGSREFVSTPVSGFSPEQLQRRPTSALANAWSLDALFAELN